MYSLGASFELLTLKALGKVLIFFFDLAIDHAVLCQGWNFGGRRSVVIDKSILWNRVMYYVGKEYYLAMV